MGYLHIDNLYKDTRILMFRECYALEKIHGTSAHIHFRRNESFANGLNINFFSGGEKMANFLSCFDIAKLTASIQQNVSDHITEFYIYGEAYGGAMQKMSATYGKTPKFIAFDVKFVIGGNETWIDVPSAHDFCTKLDLDFVHYTKIPCTIEAIDAERDADSVQAIRNGCGTGKKREGIVLRPLVELVISGSKEKRLICKHKRDEFRETATPKEVNPNRQAEVMAAGAAAAEWVTNMRLDHVLDKLQAGGVVCDITKTGEVCKAMVEDVVRESAGLLVWNDDIGKAVATQARAMFHARIKKIK